MAAITWRQLVGSDDSGAFKALHAAGETFNSGFDAVNKAIASQQLGNQTREDIGRKANVAAYLDAVQQANTPEAAAALQADPRMQALGAAVDPRDRDLVRNAIETRLASTRQNVTAGQTFQDTQTAWNSRDSVNAAFDKAMASKDPTQIQAFMESIPANHPARVEYGTKLLAMTQGNAKFATDQVTAANQQARDAAETVAIPQRVAADQERNRIAAAQAKVHADEVGLRTQEALDKRLTTLNENVVANTPGLTSKPAQEAISNYIKSLPEGDRTRMENAMNRLSSNPKYSGMSVGDAIAAARGTVDTSGEGVKKWLWNSTGDSIESAADKMLADPNYRANKQLRTDALEQLTLQRDVLKQSLYPTPPKPAAEAAGVDAALAKKQAEAAKQVDSVTPTDISKLPPPTLRLTSPADSPAGRMQRRVFEEQQKAVGKQAELQAKSDQAKQLVAEILATGDARKAAQLQDSPEFALFDRATKAQIFGLVNGTKKVK